MLEDFGALEEAPLDAAAAAAGGFAAAGAGVTGEDAADVFEAPEGVAEGFAFDVLAANHVFTPLWPRHAPAFVALLV